MKYNSEIVQIIDKATKKEDCSAELFALKEVCRDEKFNDIVRKLNLVSRHIFENNYPLALDILNSLLEKEKSGKKNKLEVNIDGN